MITPEILPDDQKPENATQRFFNYCVDLLMADSPNIRAIEEEESAGADFSSYRIIGKWQSGVPIYGSTA